MKRKDFILSSALKISRNKDAARNTQAGPSCSVNKLVACEKRIPSFAESRGTNAVDVCSGFPKPVSQINDEHIIKPISPEKKDQNVSPAPSGETSMENSPSLAGLYSPLTPLIMKRNNNIETNNMDEPNLNETAEQNSNVVSAVAKPVKELFNKVILKTAFPEINDRNDSPATNDEISMENSPSLAGLYSPLTPLIMKYINNIENNNMDEPNLNETDEDGELSTILLFDSLGEQILTSNDNDAQGSEKSSPLPYMSPKTFELFTTLNNTVYLGNNDNETNLSDVDVVDISTKKRNVTVEDSDTDCDYIPDSNSDSSDKDFDSTVKKQKNSSKANKGREDIANTLPVAHCSNVQRNEVSSNLAMEDIANTSLEDEESSTRKRRGRKRKHEECSMAEAKHRKFLNLPYASKSGMVSSKKFNDYKCSCNELCYMKISREDRETEFYRFVTLGSYEAQLLYITQGVTEYNKKRIYKKNDSNAQNQEPQKTNKQRVFSRTYKLNNVAVCRDMYKNTLQISTQRINRCLVKSREGTLKDKRGATGGFNKTPDADVLFLKNIINRLPKYVSHYRRAKKSDALYLQPGLNLRKIYEQYILEFRITYGFDSEKKSLSYHMVRKIFLRDFNLHFKRLKKDTCNRCDSFAIQIKNCKAGDERIKLEHERNKHQNRAEQLRHQMESDMARAKSDDSFECLTYDLEKTLPLPRIPTGIIFYKRQLWIYNCGVHAGSTDIGHCYVWVEGEAGRGAQEVSSCLKYHIANKLGPNVKHLVLWSDCCGGQNRNIKVVLMLKAVLAAHPTLESITLKYLESGHSFLPNDTDFSKIETQLQFNERLYTVDDYIAVMRSCKKVKPLHVKKMQKENFFSTQELEKNITNRKTFTNKDKVNWLKTKQIKLEKSNKFSIFMKLDSSDEFFELDLEKRKRGEVFKISVDDLVLLWPNGKEIAQEKLDDLKSIYHLIPEDCREFYRNLKGNDTIQDDVDGFCGLPDFVLEEEQ